MSIFLEFKSKEELTQLADTYSSYDLRHIVMLNRQICDATEKRLNLGLVLVGLIDQANKLEAYEVSEKFQKVKSIYDLFIDKVINQKKK